MKRFLSFAAATVVAFCSMLFVPACSKGDDDNTALLEENIIDDKYDNYYEIFVYSYADSDGDGYGDFNGITQKLDYIRDMGYTGIWLMPIHPSKNYHGYDVTDYYAVNSEYGTMEDFDNLLSAAHEKGIKLILDLVVNHTADTHPWFTNAVEAFRTGKSSDYTDYYNLSYTDEDGSGTAYREKGSTGVFYECRFSSDMPDLNLDSEAVRTEISNIMKYWLGKGVDGFRLDACTSYYTESTTKSIEFVGWLQTEAEKYNPDAYIVGEVWSGKSTITNYYQNSGADSFFCFPASQDGYIFSSVYDESNATATLFYNTCGYVEDTACGHIAAPFLGNHDTGRAAGTFRRDEKAIKFAYGLMSLYSGNTFTYYGDEIGMVAASSNDPDKRVGMLWDNDKTAMTKTPPGASEPSYIFDGVEEQLKDSSSILNYYKACNNVRNAFPEIMRGSYERVDCEDGKILILKKTYNSSSVTIVVNFSSETKSVTAEGTLQKGICVEGSIEQSGTSLSMPSWSIAVLK